MEITAQYQLSPKEVRSGILTISPLRLVAIYAMALVIPVVIDTGGFRHLRLTDVVIIPVVEGVMVYIFLRSQRRQSRRLMVPSTLTLTDESVTLALPTSTVTHKWSAFVRVRSVEDLWLFYTTKQCAMIIPKRAFDAVQQEQIEALVRRSAADLVGQPQSV